MVNVLVVDDSAFFRVNLSQVINSDQDLKVISTVKDGDSALEKIKQLCPDVITLDFRLAGIDGKDLIKRIMQEHPLPIIIVSAFDTIGSEEAITALESGVFDFIEKPKDFRKDELWKIKDELINKIKTAARIGIKKPEPAKKAPMHVKFKPTTKKIVLIASSTGGPQTLERFITEIPGNIPCPILIVQHMPPVFTRSLADRLDSLSQIHVVEATEGDEIMPGTAYIAPGDFHMTLRQLKEGAITKEIISLNQEEREEGVRPCANKLFRSVAPIYKDNTIAIVLTGMGYDGTDGAREIKKYNGLIIAQSEATSIIYGMPKSIVTNDLADEVIDIDKMAVALAQVMDI